MRSGVIATKITMEFWGKLERWEGHVSGQSARAPEEGKGEGKALQGKPCQAGADASASHFQTAMSSDHLESIVTFLQEIGLSIREEALPEDTFLPGIRISRGTLVFDRERLTWPADLLHEAGHLATVPAARRGELDDCLANLEEISELGEMEATAWSFAAATHLSLPLSALFHEGGYHGRSQSLILTYSAGVYPGVAGLEHAGMTATGRRAVELGARPFPHMSRWLRG